MILFLDIDGVLHPDPATQEQAFCNRHHFCKLLITLPYVKVVISSDWRLHHSLEEIKSFILKDAEEDLAERIVGVTPFVPEWKVEYCGRERECLMWLQENNEKKWLAIDDIASNFSFGSSQVYLTDYRIGLTENDIKLLIEKISTH